MVTGAVARWGRVDLNTPLRSRLSDSSSSFLSRHGVAIALAAIVVLAAALRLFHLDSESIWLDEAFSVATARSTVGNILFETSEDFHPPLYFFLLYGWFHLTDGSGSSARLLSVAFSLCATLATYAAGRLLVDTRTGILAALLIAVSTFQVEYAQEARMYSLLALLATLSTIALVRLSRTHGTAGDAGPQSPLVSPWWLAYVGATILLIYTHAYSVFVLVAHGLAVLAARARHPRAHRFLEQWFTAQLAVAIAFLPWLSTFAVQFLTVQRGFWIAAPTWADVFDPVAAYAGSQALVWLLVPLAVLGLLRVLRMTRQPSALISPCALLSAWWIVPIGLPFLLSMISSPVFLPKYTDRIINSVRDSHGGRVGRTPSRAARLAPRRRHDLRRLCPGRLSPDHAQGRLAAGRSRPGTCGRPRGCRRVPSVLH